jgi:hypothetical protein
MIYAAQFDAMNALVGYLTENCCQGVTVNCSAPVCVPATAKKQAKERA